MASVVGSIICAFCAGSSSPEKTMSKYPRMPWLKISSNACQRAAMTVAALVALAVGVGATPGRSASQLDATASPVRLLPVTSHRMVAQSASTGMTHVPISGPDTWGAVDALGRVLPDFRQVGPPRAGKTVGIFYFTANNQPGHPILNNAAILAKNPNRSAHLCYQI